MPLTVVLGQEAKIKSALGMRLGAKCNTKEKETVTEEDGSELYPFTPPKKRPPFDTFLIEVTATTRIISQIWATAAFNTKKEAIAERDKIATALENRYGEPEGSGALAEYAAQFDGFIIVKGGRYIMVTISFENKKQRLFLKYVDRQLKRQAKDERIKLEKEGGKDNAKLGGAL